MTTLAQNIGTFGNKRCLEKMDEFLISSPKTDSYESLDDLIEKSQLYDLCFKQFDELLYITPAGQSSVGNVYQEDCKLVQDLKEKAMQSARFNSEF